MAKKFNFKTGKYESYQFGDGWYVRVLTDMDAKINCASCGNVVAFGDCYTSRAIQTERGFGYSVCEECYNKECEEARYAEWARK